ncbi:MAG TPA: hypothetical protein VL856_09165 [Acidimicrobiia bacterium]|jgi:hypothetical protein|nr:hypothetical protein [Acidimicrobiia bacterium]
MSTITAPVPRAHNWVSSRILFAVLIVIGIAMLAFSIGRVTAADHSSAPVAHVTTPSGSEWGWRMCAHGVPCR